MLFAFTLSLTLLFQQEETQSVTLPPPAPVWELLREKYDANHDGKISPEEHHRGAEAFAHLDHDGDGFLTQEDINSAEDRVKPKTRSGKVRNRFVLAPKVGDVAPDFDLRLLLHAKENPEQLGAKKKEEKPQTIVLSSFIGKKPVALIFGSYT